MKKQKIQFAILVALLFLCIGGFLVLKNSSFEEEEASDPIFMTKIEKTNVTALSVAGQKEYSFIKEGEEWIEENMPQEDIKETAVDTLLTTLCSLSTNEKVILAADDLSEYGLDEPVFTVTVTHDDQETVILIGDKNALLNKYFAKRKDSDEIYLISYYSVSSLMKEAEDFIEEPETETTE